MENRGHYTALGREIKVGDIVVWSGFNQYSGCRLYKVIKLTPKAVRIQLVDKNLDVVESTFYPPGRQGSCVRGDALIHPDPADLYKKREMLERAE